MFFLIPLFFVTFVILGIRVAVRIMKSVSGTIIDPEKIQRISAGYEPGDEYMLRRIEQNRQKLTKTEVALFRLADKNKGRITLSDAVVETGLGIKEAEEILNELVDGSHVRMEVTDTGSVIYEFPEIITKYEKKD